MNENTKELAELLTLLNDTPFTVWNDRDGEYVESKWTGKTEHGRVCLRTLVEQLKENIGAAEAYLAGERSGMNETTYVAALLTALANEHYWTCLNSEITATKCVYTTGVQHSRQGKFGLQCAEQLLHQAIVDAEEKVNRVETYLENKMNRITELAGLLTAALGREFKVVPRHFTRGEKYDTAVIQESRKELRLLPTTHTLEQADTLLSQTIGRLKENITATRTYLSDHVTGCPTDATLLCTLLTALSGTVHTMQIETFCGVTSQMIHTNDKTIHIGSAHAKLELLLKQRTKDVMAVERYLGNNNKLTHGRFDKTRYWAYLSIRNRKLEDRLFTCLRGSSPDISGYTEGCGYEWTGTKPPWIVFYTCYNDVEKITTTLDNIVNDYT